MIIMMSIAENTCMRPDGTITIIIIIIIIIRTTVSIAQNPCGRTTLQGNHRSEGEQATFMGVRESSML